MTSEYFKFNVRHLIAYEKYNLPLPLSKSGETRLRMRPEG